MMFFGYLNKKKIVYINGLLKYNKNKVAKKFNIVKLCLLFSAFQSLVLLGRPVLFKG